VGGPAYKAMYSKYDDGAQNYYGCITALDEQVGRLRALLRSLKIEKDTMLWFCSDNGPFGRTGTEGTRRGSTGGLRGRKFSLFSGGTNVPGLLEWPGHVKAGREETLSCSTLDYVPTVQELVGYQSPKPARPMDGISLVPLIQGTMKSRPTPICFRYVVPKETMFDSPMLAMVNGKYKLLSNLVDDGKHDLLFDIEADRGETTDIGKQHPEKVRSMKEQLTAWMASCERSFNGADYNDPTFRPFGTFEPLRADWPAGGAAD
jgi:arylsulfatase A-like enzyme